MAIYRTRIHLRPFEQVVASFPQISPATSNQVHLENQLFWALSSVERHIPLLPNCFSLSCAGMRMALRRGLPTEVVLGIRNTPEGLKAHAWLKTDQRILSGAKNHRTFTVTAIIRPGELITQLPAQTTLPNGTTQFIEEEKK